MAKRSAAEKAATHEKILRHAAQSFRARGGGVGILEVMRELGLTQGGFYRHFASKEDLFIESVALALQQVSERLEAAAAKAEEGKQVEAMISAYLSSDQLLHPETWCALATLAPEIGRLPSSVRKRLDGALRSYMEELAQYMPGATTQERRANFLILFSGMAGAMAMIRAFGDSGMRDQVLHLTREYYLKTFAATASASRPEPEAEPATLMTGSSRK